MKKCSTCKYTTPTDPRKPRAVFCTHNSAIWASDRQDGEYITFRLMVTEARNNTNRACGSEGRYYEPA